jgi:hypothetical protein
MDDAGVDRGSGDHRHRGDYAAFAASRDSAPSTGCAEGADAADAETASTTGKGAQGGFCFFFSYGGAE